MSPLSRIAFVTIGCTPRTDIVPEMVSEIFGDQPSNDIQIREFGVLDGLDGADLDAMKATADEHVFATRDAQNNEISVSAEKTEARLETLLDHVEGLDFDMVVLLCTGTRIRPRTGMLIIESQRVVDHSIAALSIGDAPLGVLVPFERQISTLFSGHDLPSNARFAAASPYDGAPLGVRASALADCPVTVMHCMGYSRAMRDAVRAAIPGHVLHARGMVAGFVRQLL